MNKILAWVMTNPVAALLFPAVGVLLAFLAGYMAGRGTPTKTVTVEKQVETKHEEQYEALRVQLTQLTTQLQTMASQLERRNDVVTNRRVVKQPDGTVTIETKVEDKTTTTASTTTTTATTTAATTDYTKELRLLRDELKLHEKVQVVEVAGRTPRWILGATAGLGLREALRGDLSYTLGGFAQRRIGELFGVQLFGGAGLTTRLDGSLLLTASF